MRHELLTLPDAAAVALRAADLVAAQARSAVAERGRFTFAVSGGRTPWAMFAELTKMEVPWVTTQIFQVDERVAPDGDADRNLMHLREALGSAPAEVVPMPVEEADLEAAAEDYARQLPGSFDLIHLGLGPDGHTASLVPGDPVLDITDHLVAVTNPYQGHRRMTLTYPGLARTAGIVWLVTGEDKRDALERLLAGDRSIPAGRVEAKRSVIVADAAAAMDLKST
jgi:6-phosphogluconolactonase